VVSVAAECAERKVTTKFKRAVETILETDDLMEHKINDEMHLHEVIAKEKLYELIIDLLIAYYNVPHETLSSFTHHAINNLFNYIFDILTLPCGGDVDYSFVSKYFSDLFHMLVVYVPEPGFVGSTKI
jgi:hypothetical protein